MIGKEIKKFNVIMLAMLQPYFMTLFQKSFEIQGKSASVHVLPGSSGVQQARIQ